MLDAALLLHGGQTAYNPAAHAIGSNRRSSCAHRALLDND